MSELKLSVKELILLAGVLGAQTVIGVDDPWPGMLTEEIQAELMPMLERLDQEGKISRREDGRLLMESSLARVISVTAFPEAVLLVGANSHDGLTERHLYLTRTGWVEQEQTRAEELRLSWHPAAGQEALARAAALLGISAQGAAPEGCELPEQELSRVHEVAREQGRGAAKLTLLEVGVPPVAAEALAEALAEPTSSGSVLLMYPRSGDWAVTSLGLFAGARGMWMIETAERAGARWTQLTPADAQGALERLNRLVAEAVPAPVLA